MKKKELKPKRSLSNQWKKHERGKGGGGGVGGPEETRVEHSEGKASDWVSELAFIAWRDKLQHKDFIGERGFSKWISSFHEIVEDGFSFVCINPLVS